MRLIPLETLDEKGYAEVWREEDDLHLVVLRHEDRVIAYYNECPHQGRALNFASNRFLFTPAGNLVCPHHGAAFQPGDGLCVSGPCLGQSLHPFEVKVEDGWVIATDPKTGQQEPPSGESE